MDLLENPSLAVPLKNDDRALPVQNGTVSHGDDTEQLLQSDQLNTGNSELAHVQFETKKKSMLGTSALMFLSLQQPPGSHGSS